MNVTGCVPLAGLGLVARRGALIALTDGTDPGPDALLTALAAVADANGDGAALVLAGTRAALERGGRPTWACAGVTFAGQVAVLVHGEAMALVCAGGGPEIQVTDNGSMVPVVRTFTGSAVAEEEETVLRHSGPAHASLILQDPVTEALPPVDAGLQPGYEPTMLAGVAQPVAEPAAAPADGLGWPGEQAGVPGDPFASPTGPAGPAQAMSDSESWFRADAQRVSGPTLRMTQTDPAGAGALPEAPIADLSTMELVQLGAVEPVLVDGAMCARMHFNAPEAMLCRECGLSMPEDTRDMRHQPRPPLGLLLVDDGRGFILDRDYVIGREPVLDIDVAAGRAAPLRITDPKGTVSRLHLRVSLIGWQVEGPRRAGGRRAPHRPVPALRRIAFRHNP